MSAPGRGRGRGPGPADVAATQDLGSPARRKPAEDRNIASTVHWPDLARRAGALLVLAAVGLCLAMPARAAQASHECASRIAGVIRDISARDLSTVAGPPLDAFITINPAARAEAAALDRVTGEPRGPLWCMPVAVKDNFATFDMPMTDGSAALIGNWPPWDATLVARLRRAGAIIVGKTNMDDFAFGIRGLTSAGGRVGNAYDPAMSPGGSSAGSGVAVGAGFVPLALGSDNCGSLRLPAVYNGAIALRPTQGRFSTRGVFPIGTINGAPGLIAHDPSLLASGLAALDPQWNAAAATARHGLRGVRLGILRSVDGKDLWRPANAGTRALFDQAIAALRKDGATIVDGLALDRFEQTMGSSFVQGFGPAVDRFLASYRAVRPTWRAICESGKIRPEWTPAECLSLAAPDPTTQQAAAAQMERNRQVLLALMRRRHLDGLVYPPDGRGGARAGVSPAVTCVLAGASGLPAVAFPIGLDPRGMPVGLEILGPSDSDERLVAMMAAYSATGAPLPSAPRVPADPRLAALGIPAQNELRLAIGRRAFAMRTGPAPDELTAATFRKLVNRIIATWPSSALR